MIQEAAEEAQAGTASLREAIETSQQREVEVSFLKLLFHSREDELWCYILNGI